MKLEVTPEEAHRPAGAMIKYFKKHQMNVKAEKPAWQGAPYRTTLVAEKAGRHILVEAQGTLSYGRSLKDLVAWIATHRYYAEVYIATTSDSVLQAGTLQEMKMEGVGLFVIDDDDAVVEHQRAKNPALVITPDPTLKLGPSKLEVQAAIYKFNEVDRKDGLRDMCEIVERFTAELGLAACRKNWLKIPEINFKDKDWASQINELGRREAYNPHHNVLLETGLKDDLHSFRGARNLVDHKVHTRREDTKRQKQFAERMMQGPRLVSELLSLKRKIK
jgi:hypothetical protein